MPSWLNESRTKNLSFQTPFYQPLQFDSLPDMDPSHMRPKVNLRKYMTKVEDQGYRKSCVAEAVAGSLEYLIKRYRGPRRDGTEFDVSRMFIVWVGNMIEKESQEPPNNEGAWLPEAILGVLKYVFCDERLWPPNEYTLFSQPPKKVFEAAKNHTIIPLVIPPNLDSMKKCLNYELPFLIGFDAALFRKSDMRRINNNYNRTGPARQDSQGHVVLIVGYDDHKQLFLARNSWGSQWGFGGYFYIPYKYLTDKNLWDMMKMVYGP